MFERVLQNIALIEKNKSDILDMWLGYEIVQTKLLTNTMDIDFFREKFASKVFDYATSVVKSVNKAGDCPVIGVMLMLFKRKNIPLSDVFMICVHFKNALLHFAYKKSILDEDMIKEIAMLMDYNFEGVISEYVLLYYKDATIVKPTIEPVVCSINKEEYLNELKNIEITVELDSHKATSAQLYLQDVDVDMEMVEELDELENDTLNALEAEETLDQNALTEAAHLFEQYAKVLNGMYEFEELTYTLTILADLLKNVDFSTLEEDTRYMVKIYLKAIITDLRSWRNSIFLTMDAQDIHYLDKTLMSSIAQIQITLMPAVNSAGEDEIEFF